MAILQAAMYVKGRQLANGLCHDDDDEACPMTMFKVKVVLIEAKCQIFLYYYYLKTNLASNPLSLLATNIHQFLTDLAHGQDLRLRSWSNL